MFILPTPSVSSMPITASKCSVHRKRLHARFDLLRSFHLLCSFSPDVPATASHLGRLGVRACAFFLRVPCKPSVLRRFAASEYWTTGSESPNFNRKRAGRNLNLYQIYRPQAPSTELGKPRTWNSQKSGPCSAKRCWLIVDWHRHQCKKCLIRNVTRRADSIV